MSSQQLPFLQSLLARVHQVHSRAVVLQPRGTLKGSFPAPLKKEAQGL